MLLAPARGNPDSPRRRRRHSSSTPRAATAEKDQTTWRTACHSDGRPSRSPEARQARSRGRRSGRRRQAGAAARTKAEAGAKDEAGDGDRPGEKARRRSNSTSISNSSSTSTSTTTSIISASRSCVASRRQHWRILVCWGQGRVVVVGGGSSPRRSRKISGEQSSSRAGVRIQNIVRIFLPPQANWARR